MKVGDVVYYKPYNTWLRCTITRIDQEEVWGGTHSWFADIYDLLDEFGKTHLGISDTSVYSIGSYVWNLFNEYTIDQLAYRVKNNLEINERYDPLRPLLNDLISVEDKISDKYQKLIDAEIDRLKGL